MTAPIINPKNTPWRGVLDAALELTAIIGSVVTLQLLCWGMWAIR